MQRGKSWRESCDFILKQIVKLQFSITIDPLWKLNYEGSVSRSARIFNPLRPGYACEAKHIVKGEKKPELSSSTYCLNFLSQQQHLHFSTEAGSEQRL